VGLSAVALTKLDGDARGGAALSVATITGCPILYSSTGESLEAIETFHPDRMASRILDMGDILTLIEQAQKTFDQEESKKLAQKIATDQFTLQDFLEQLQQVRKLGNLKGIMGMMPGVGKLKQQIAEFDEKQINRTEAIIRSMTPLERTQPRVLNGSRRMRIAKGSGTSVTEVNQLMQRFEQAAKMMKTMAKTGPAPRTGFPIPARKPAKQEKKKGSRSGNPAKRAAENQGLSYQPPSQGSSFGLGN
jgi:signal recognition particle subunit SRP54